MSNEHLVSCVIPCYHSEETLPQVVAEIRETFAENTFGHFAETIRQILEE